MVVYPNVEEEATSGSRRFLDFLDKTFALLSNSPVIKKISLCLAHRHARGVYDDYSLCVNRWIFTAMELGLIELHLHADTLSSVELETKLLTSNTLVKLTISGAHALEVEHVFFPALTSLSLLSVGIDIDNYCRLLDGCPVLEELIIHDDDPIDAPCCGWHMESESIKRLVVFANLPAFKDFHDIVLIEAPSLVYLDYSSYVSEKYQCYGLDLLVEAKLSIWLWESTNDYDNDNEESGPDSIDDDSDYDSYYDVAEPKASIFVDVTNLVAVISNITTLHLSPDSLEALHFCCKSMPVFNNLLTLSIESNREKGWQVMPLLLKSCPNLETLVIKGLVHRVTNICGDACACIPKKQRKKTVEEEICCLWTCQVKFLEISEYEASFQELKQMRHFLGKLECLETVKVSVEADSNNNMEFLRANINALPRLSSNCNIQFI